VENAHRPVVVWLLTIFGLIAAMVAVGGITRLTGSGLSMVEWHPLMGAVPPLGAEAWQETFAKYQTSPQYQLVNRWMTLGDFKRIFMWEYLHRLLGRFIGLAFFLPWLFFLVRKKIPRGYGGRIAVAFFLGGAQGLLGWFMVKSGLVDRPEVSHYRLAAHLLLAFFVAQWVLWLALDLTFDPGRKKPDAPPWARPAIVSMGLLLVVQIVWGAFMAGKRAGVLYATFPDMNGFLFPPGISELTPAWRNLVENAVGIHAIHRHLAWFVLLGLVGVALGLRNSLKSGRGRIFRHGLWGLALIQFGLGALTVILHVPISVAVLHQVGALFLLSALVCVLHALKGPSPGSDGGQ
jgi:cytochrome c oxidase assembly protein subunit 15